MPRKKEPASVHLQNRITGMQFIRGKDLQDNSQNWRVHPQHQRDAMAGVLREIGIAGALLVYHSEKHGGLTVIDGHLRKGDYPDQEWPCLMTDLNDAEADYMLLVHDPIAAQAEADKEKLAHLMQDIGSGDAAVQQLLSSLATQYKLHFTMPPPLDTTGLPEEDDAQEAFEDEEYIPSHVRMVQLFLDTTTFPKFKNMVQELREKYGTETETDTVMECLQRAYDSLDRECA